MTTTTVWFLALAIAICSCSEKHGTAAGQQPNGGDQEAGEKAIVRLPGSGATTATPPKPAVGLVDADYCQDSTAAFFKKEYEVAYYKRGGDTLEIVSGSDLPYYPFGHCQDSVCLRKKMPLFAFRPEVAATSESTMLLRGVYNSSFVKFVFDAEKKAMQVVAGKVTDPGIVLANGISVGMTENQVVGTFVKNKGFAKGRQFSIIQLTSVVDGIRQYYNLESGRLKSVEFATTYLYNKK